MQVTKVPEWDAIANSDTYKSLSAIEQMRVHNKWMRDKIQYDQAFGRKIDEDYAEGFRDLGFQPVEVSAAMRVGMNGTLQSSLSSEVNEAIDEQEGILYAGSPLDQMAGSTAQGLLAPFRAAVGIGQAATHVSDWIWGHGTEGIDEISEGLNRESESYAQDVNSDIVGNLSSGNIVGAGQALFNNVLQQLPNMAITIASAGVSAIAGQVAVGASAFGSAANEVLGDKNLSTAQKVGLIVSNTALEVLGESLGTIPMFRKMTNETQGLLLKEMMKKGNVVKIGKELGKAGITEFSEEAFTEGGQYLADTLIRGEKPNVKEFTKRMLNAGITGGAMGAGMAGGAMASAARTGISESSSRKWFRDNGLMEGDKFQSKKARENAIEEYYLNGEPITQGEPTRDERIKWLEKRIEEYDKSDEHTSGWDEKRKEWEKRLEELKNNPEKTEETSEPADEGFDPTATPEPEPAPEPVPTPEPEPVTSPVPVAKPEPATPPVAKSEPVSPTYKLTDDDRKLPKHIQDSKQYMKPIKVKHPDNSDAGDFYLAIVDIDPDTGDVFASGDAGYTNKSLQNLDEGATRAQQIKKIADNPIVEKFFLYELSNEGTPIIGEEDMHTESGNARTKALRRMYKQGNADGYRQRLIEEAKRLGLPFPEDASMPAMVRIPVNRRTQAQRMEFVNKANERNDVLFQDAANQAKNDAERLSKNLDKIISLYVENKQDHVITAANQDFIMKFRELLGSTPNDIDSKGHTTEDFETRVSNAFLGALFHGTDNQRGLIENLVRKADSLGLVNVRNGLATKVPKLMKLAKDKPDFGITSELGTALQHFMAYKAAKKSNTNLTAEEFAKQQDMFSESGEQILTPEQRQKGMDNATLELYYMMADANSAKSVKDMLQEYLNMVQQEETQGKLPIIDTEVRTKESILASARKKTKKSSNPIRSSSSKFSIPAHASMANDSLKDVDISLPEGVTMLSKEMADNGKPYPKIKDENYDNMLREAGYYSRMAAKKPIREVASLSMPELVKLFNAMKGSMKVKVSNKMRPGVRGFFTTNKGIMLLNELAKFEQIGGEYVVSSDSMEMDAQKLIEQINQKTNIPVDEITYKSRPGTGELEGKSILNFFWEDPNQTRAKETFAHEIGHMLDWDNKTLARGNILGHMGGLMNSYLKSILGETGGDEILTNEEKAELRKQADHDVTDGIPTGQKGKFRESEDGKRQINEQYAALLKAEVRNRRGYLEPVVRKELYSMSKWWRPFKEGKSEAYDRYRKSSEELTADAISVFLNAPEEFVRLAPETWRLMQNYQQNKQEFWDNYQKLIDKQKKGLELAGITSRMQESYERNRKRDEEMAKQKEEKSKVSAKNYFGSVIKAFVEEYHSILQVAEQAGRKDAIQNDIDKVRHMSSVDWYGRQLQKFMDELNKAGLTGNDIDTWMELKRDENDPSLRQTFNPQGLKWKDAEKLVKEMESKLGKEKTDALYRFHEAYWKLRKETIIRKIKDSGAYDQALIDHVKDNEWYSRREVDRGVEVNEKGELVQPKGTGSAKIHGLTGTLNDTKSPLKYTFENDVKLMMAIERNNLRRDVVDMLLKQTPDSISEVKPNGPRSYPSVAPGYVRVNIMRNGKFEVYDVVKELGEALYPSRDADMGRIIVGLSKMNNLFRKFWTTYNPVFLLKNPIRDSFSTYVKMKDPVSFVKWLKYHAKGFKEAYKGVVNNDSDVYAWAMKHDTLIPTRHSWGEDISYDKQLETAAKMAGTMDSGDGHKWYRMDKLAQDFMLKMGEVSELSTKLGYVMLEADVAGGLDKLDADAIRHQVVKNVGSPDFMARGKFSFVTNNLYLFSNAMFQGWSSVVESAKTVGPKQMVWRWMKCYGIPKMIEWSLYSGALFDLAVAMGFDEDDLKWLKSIKKAYDNASQYDLFNYLNIPLFINDDNKTVFFRLPLAEDVKPETMMLTAMLDFMYNKRDKENGIIEDSFNILETLIPQPSPSFGLIKDSIDVARGRNPYNEFLDHPGVNRTLWNAGGVDKAYGVGKYFVEKYNPISMLRFDSRETDYFMQFVKNLSGMSAFIKVTNYGKYEQEKARENEKLQKKSKIKARIKNPIRW